MMIDGAFFAIVLTAVGGILIGSTLTSARLKLEADSIKDENETLKNDLSELDKMLEEKEKALVRLMDTVTHLNKERADGSQQL